MLSRSHHFRTVGAINGATWSWLVEFECTIDTSLSDGPSPEKKRIAKLSSIIGMKVKYFLALSRSQAGGIVEFAELSKLSLRERALSFELKPNRRQNTRLGEKLQFLS